MVEQPSDNESITFHPKLYWGHNDVRMQLINESQQMCPDVSLESIQGQCCHSHWQASSIGPPLEVH